MVDDAEKRSAAEHGMQGLRIGQRAETRRTFTPNDLAHYAALTGGARDPEKVPGPLIGGLFSYLLGTQLPGPGTIYLKQRFVFLHPADVGEELTAVVEVVRLRPEKELVNLRTTCTDPAGKLLCEGEALVLVRDVVR